jgi:hypothetical protein
MGSTSVQPKVQQPSSTWFNPRFNHHGVILLEKPEPAPCVIFVDSTINNGEKSPPELQL